MLLTAYSKIEERNVKGADKKKETIIYRDLKNSQLVYIGKDKKACMEANTKDGAH